MLTACYCHHVVIFFPDQNPLHLGQVRAWIMDKPIPSHARWCCVTMSLCRPQFPCMHTEGLAT